MTKMENREYDEAEKFVTALMTETRIMSESSKEIGRIVDDNKTIVNKDEYPKYSDLSPREKADALGMDDEERYGDRPLRRCNREDGFCGY